MIVRVRLEGDGLHHHIYLSKAQYLNDYLFYIQLVASLYRSKDSYPPSLLYSILVSARSNQKWSIGVISVLEMSSAHLLVFIRYSKASFLVINYLHPTTHFQQMKLCETLVALSLFE